MHACNNQKQRLPNERLLDRIETFFSSRLVPGQPNGCAAWFTKRHKIDTHFTYPKDGNLHFSLKFIDELTAKEKYIGVFHDKIKTKIIDLQTREQSVTEIARDVSEDQFSWLMPRIKQEAISNYKTNNRLFQFPVCAIPINNGVIKISETEKLRGETIKAKHNDVFVDTSSFETGILNISASLYGDGLTLPRFMDAKYFTAVESLDSINLELAVMYTVTSH